MQRMRDDDIASMRAVAWALVLDGLTTATMAGIATTRAVVSALVPDRLTTATISVEEGWPWKIQ